jgi:hypothetical protein
MIAAAGNRMAHTVLSYLEAFEHHAEVLKKEPGNVASQIMMSKFDPGTLKQFEAIRTRAQRLAEDLLQAGATSQSRLRQLRCVQPSVRCDEGRQRQRRFFRYPVGYIFQDTEIVRAGHESPCVIGTRPGHH